MIGGVNMREAQIYIKKLSITFKTDKIGGGGGVVSQLGGGYLPHPS